MNAGNSAPQNIIPELRDKAIAGRSFLLIMSKMMRFIVQMAVIILYARKLSYTEYGLYQSVWLYLNVISIISLFGLPSLLLAVSAQNIRQWIRQNKLLFFLIAGILNIVPLLYIFFGSTAYGTASRLLLTLLTVVQNISIIIETSAIKKEKEIPVLVSNFIFSCGFLVCHIWLLYHGYSLSILLAGIVLMFIIKIFIILIAGKKIQHCGQPDTVLLSGKQWFYLGVNDVLGVVAVWLDKWVILLLLSLTQFAVYFNGAYEIPVFGIMLSAVGNIMLVEFSKRQGDDAKKIRFLFGSSSQLLAAIVFPAFCFLLFNYAEVFTLVFGNKYTGSVPIFFITLFILPVRIIFSTTALQVYNRSDLIVKGSLLDIILAVILMFIFYPVLGMQGPALAFVISSYVQAGFYLWHTGKLLDRKVSCFFPFKKLLLMLLVAGAVTCAGFFAFRQMIYPVNIIAGMLLCIILIMLMLRYVYKKELRG